MTANRPAKNHPWRKDMPNFVQQLNDAADEIKRLRKERDEARRMYCHEMWDSQNPHDLADDLGWDCFKEER